VTTATKLLLATGIATIIGGSWVAQAQPTPAFQQAILAELDPATRAEITRRATGGNSVSEVLDVVLLNNLQLADAPNAKIVAVDFGREVAVIDVPDKPMRVVRFNRQTLTVKN